MKKAFIEQLFLGFLILSSIAVFVATVNDERQVRSKAFDLKDIADESIKTMAIMYQRSINSGTMTEEEAMCVGETVATNLLSSSSLGSELVNNGSISYTWRDSNGDNRPDSVTSNVAQYAHNTFWYKLLGKDSFSIPSFQRAVNLDVNNFDVTVYFRDVINAGYYNMVGVYELDSDGCVSNPRLILDNKNDFSQGDILAEIPMPESRIFFISDGYRRFGNYSGGNNSTVSMDSQIEFEHDCVNSPDVPPTVKITTSDGQVQRNTDSENPQFNNLPQRANIFFQDSEFNHDNGYDHMNEIAESQYGKFIAYIEPTSNYTPEAWAYYNSLSSRHQSNISGSKTYEEWLNYASRKNIDFSTDPDDNFVFVSEDLSTINGDDPWNSDRDFTDMSINMQKIFIPEPVDPSTISSDSVINLNCP